MGLTEAVSGHNKNGMCMQKKKPHIWELLAVCGYKSLNDLEFYIVSVSSSLVCLI